MENRQFKMAMAIVGAILPRDGVPFFAIGSDGPLGASLSLRQRPPLLKVVKISNHQVYENRLDGGSLNGRGCLRASHDVFGDIPNDPYPSLTGGPFFPARHSLA